VVEIIKDLEDLKSIAQYCRYVLYKVDDLGEGRYRVRIRTGRYGWDGEVEGKRYEDLMEWLASVDAIEVVDSVEDAVFFA